MLKSNVAVTLAFVPPKVRWFGDKVFRVQAQVTGSLGAMEQYTRRRDGNAVYIPTDSFGLGNTRST